MKFWPLLRAAEALQSSRSGRKLVGLLWCFFVSKVLSLGSRAFAGFASFYCGSTGIYRVHNWGWLWLVDRSSYVISLRRVLQKRNDGPAMF